MTGDDRLREALHRLHGAVLLEARDHMPEDHGEAVLARGKGRAYENVLFLLDDMDDHEGLPDKLDGDLWEAYAELSRAAIAADREMYDGDDGDADIAPGVQ